MSLPTGSRFGPYTVTGLIGEGGMGQVYRARDTKLDRDVAIKVLPDSFAMDADRVARFTREAKTLAALNHPHIAAIYGIEEQGSTRALVMELVEGEDLAALLTRGPLALDETLTIARQVAAALETAHEHGIIHRDLKPANINIRSDGTAKVLDFGLAKAVTPADASGSTVANSPTLTARATEMGMILGTAAYMAPEQAKGRVVDRRADVWAFGAVVYEMLAGRRVFNGDDVTEILASVIKDTPDFGALPPTVPARLKALLGRCLERDLKKRQRDMGDVLLELTEIAERPVPRGPQELSGRPSRRAVWLVAAATFVVGVGVGWLIQRTPAPVVAGPVRLAVAAPVGNRTLWPQLTPDGRGVVFFSAGRLYRRSLDTFETVAIPGTDGAEVSIMSPDGRFVAFKVQSELRRVPLGGGDPVRLAEFDFPINGGSWSTANLILISRGWTGGLWTVPADGGALKQVTEPDRSNGERGHWRPHFMPDGKRVVFSIMMAGTGVNDSRIAILDVTTGKYRALFPGTDGRYLRSGHLLFFHGGAWRIVGFDADAEQTTGDPLTVLGDAFGVPPDGGVIGTQLAVSDNGAVAYLPGPAVPDRELIWIDRAGAIEPLGLPARPLEGASLSPDNRRIAMTRTESGTSQMWMVDLARKTEDRLDVKGLNIGPSWDPTGEWLSFTSERKGQYDAYVSRIDGSGDRAVFQEDYDESPVGWLNRSRRLLVKQWKLDGATAMIAVDPENTTSPTPVFSTSAPSDTVVSPNDKWLAYVSTRSGRPEVFVRALSVDAAAVRVSTDGGTDPLWSRDGLEIYFQNQRTMMAASFRGDAATPEPGVPRELFTLPVSFDLYDLSKDGRRFLVGRLVGPERPLGVRVILNWFDELRAIKNK